MSDIERQIVEFSKQSDLIVKSTAFGKDYTTYAIGGQFLAFVEVNNEQELISVVKFLCENKISYKVLGAGSNLLISDHNISDWIVKLGKGFRSIENCSETEFRVGSASSLMTVSRDLSQQGLSGLEFAGGIPATFGGAIFMNAGAHGHEISEVVTEVELLMSGGERNVLSNRDLNWEYRKSNLPKDSIVLSTKIKLVLSDSEQTFKHRAECLNYRKQTQPLTLPSAGSVFKNPSSTLSAGKLIEELGLKGYRIGEAEISSLHANWIVNPRKKASFNDVHSLIKLCQNEAKKQRDIELELEQIIWK
jgi:UDP-N-acetylmuramate dehydrogenase